LWRFTLCLAVTQRVGRIEKLSDMAFAIEGMVNVWVALAADAASAQDQRRAET